MSTPKDGTNNNNNRVSPKMVEQRASSVPSRGHINTRSRLTPIFQIPENDVHTQKREEQSNGVRSRGKEQSNDKKREDWFGSLGKYYCGPEYGGYSDPTIQGSQSARSQRENHSSNNKQNSRRPHESPSQTRNLKVSIGKTSSKSKMPHKPHNPTQREDRQTSMRDVHKPLKHAGTSTRTATRDARALSGSAILTKERPIKEREKNEGRSSTLSDLQHDVASTLLYNNLSALSERDDSDDPTKSPALTIKSEPTPQLLLDGRSLDEVPTDNKNTEKKNIEVEQPKENGNKSEHDNLNSKPESPKDHHQKKPTPREDEKKHEENKEKSETDEDNVSIAPKPRTDLPKRKIRLVSSYDGKPTKEHISEDDEPLGLDKKSKHKKGSMWGKATLPLSIPKFKKGRRKTSTDEEKPIPVSEVAKEDTESKANNINKKNRLSLPAPLPKDKVDEVISPKKKKGWGMLAMKSKGRRREHSDMSSAEESDSSTVDASKKVTVTKLEPMPVFKATKAERVEVTLDEKQSPMISKGTKPTTFLNEDPHVVGDVKDPNKKKIKRKKSKKKRGVDSSSSASSTPREGSEAESSKKKIKIKKKKKKRTKKQKVKSTSDSTSTETDSSSENDNKVNGKQDEPKKDSGGPKKDSGEPKKTDDQNDPEFETRNESDDEDKTQDGSGFLPAPHSKSDIVVPFGDMSISNEFATTLEDLAIAACND